MIEQIVPSYRAARRRLLILDYDGTLVDFKQRPELAHPSQELLDILKNLSQDRQNTVAIVSGRDHATLDEWLGRLPIALVAEHGELVKLPGEAWQMAEDADDGWKKAIMDVMQASVSAVGKTFVEEKTTGLVWHYIQADQAIATKEADKLAKRLAPVAQKNDLRVSPGKHFVEVRLGAMDKGAAIHRWLDQASWDFVIIAGDDLTDEDMFRVAPLESFTVKVGEGPTKARERIASPSDLIKLLEELAS